MGAVHENYGFLVLLSGRLVMNVVDQPGDGHVEMLLGNVRGWIRFFPKRRFVTLPRNGLGSGILVTGKNRQCILAEDRFLLAGHPERIASCRAKQEQR